VLDNYLKDKILLSLREHSKMIIQSLKNGIRSSIRRKDLRFLCFRNYGLRRKRRGGFEPFFS